MGVFLVPSADIKRGLPGFSRPDWSLDRGTQQVDSLLLASIWPIGEGPSPCCGVFRIVGASQTDVNPRH